MAEEVSISALLAELQGYGLKLLFEDEELRQASVDRCKEWGVPALGAKVGVEILFGVGSFFKEGLGERSSHWLVRFAEKTPLVRRLLESLLAITRGVSDKHPCARS